ncbi:MAG TPA: isochorismatase family cysteine hydrolase [Polyangiaceae bacterium]|nr:isochorismatase family cysteine hydrolase [Polyangiaceae bacterium]
MHTALLIVDMQNDFVLENAPAAIAGAPASLPELVRLLTAAREQKWYVVHVVREYLADGSNIELPRREAFLRLGGYAVPGTRGARIVKELTPIEGELVLVKPRFSAFMQTPLDAMLRRQGVRRVIVCGTQYPNCIRATAFDALALDYEVAVALGATSAQTDAVARANIHDLCNVGIACSSLEQLLSR